MDVVSEVIEKSDKEKSSSEKNIAVEKLIDVECYYEDFTVIDTNDVDTNKIRSDAKENYLRDLARDCMQIFFNKLSNFPTEVVDNCNVVKLPESAFDLPREKPVPVPKPLTKWQQFAKKKGIKKTKRPRTTWDDILKRWVPTYGYKKAAAEKEKQWLLEVPQNKDMYTDMFEEKKKLRAENISKNEFQRLRNIARSNKIKVPKFGIAPKEGNARVDQIQMAANIAKISTASVGRFQPNLPLDKKQKPFKKKNKKEIIQDTKKERERNMSMISTITKKQPKLNIQKAINKNLYEEQSQSRNEKSNEGTKKGKKRRRPERESKKNKKQKSAKKPASHKGKRIGRQSKGGRKRR